MFGEAGDPAELEKIIVILRDITGTDSRRKANKQYAKKCRQKLDWLRPNTAREATL